jgi:predicted RND superfamily exporter protein
VDAGARLIGSLAVGAARWRGLLLPLLLIVTILAVLGAQQVEARFDVRDFFAPTTDFVVALDRFDEHAGAQSGEPADIYVEADCTDPRTIAALRRFRTAVEGLDTRRLACDAQGRVKIGGGVLEPIELVLASPEARAAIAQRFGTAITDEDQDGVPDTREQLAAMLSFARETGVPGGEPGELVLRPDIVRSLIWLDGQDGKVAASATRLSIQIPGSRVQEQIEEARAVLAPPIEDLVADLRRHDPDARVVLTGGPIVRQASLDAILLAFRTALPLAVLLCLIVASVFMRSLRYGAVSTVPVVVVAAWLYGFMFAAGYSINVVTATIGAISIGVGIDFSVHFTMRFREELPRAAGRLEALRAAGAGTGMALVGSAVSSAVGFAILAFAPMPMFATYGLLTAIMIGFALLSSLVVLPCLLMVVTPKAHP